MEINIQPATVAPIYAQIRDQIEAQIKDGTLGQGALLTPPAALAQKLSTDTGEVQRAYFELVRSGLVSSRKAQDFMGRDKTVYMVV
jgi:DNA-binding transcriptional regulator YhcF (GntR family)